MNIIGDFLTALGVRHTDDYTRRQLDGMAFKTLFGVSKVLQTYGVQTCGVEVPPQTPVSGLPLPLLAPMKAGGTVIVTSAKDGTVHYLSAGISESMPADQFALAWTGKALLAFPAPDAAEPGYTVHRLIGFLERAKYVVLALLFAGLCVTALAVSGYGRYVSVDLMAILMTGGLGLSLLLETKSLGLKTSVADRVCGVVEAGGCDEIVTGASAGIPGLFSWSDVGLGYFTVSLLTVLLTPQYLPYLAAINVLCLPYSFWSIWYQRFRAHHWCTMCLGVQATLWMIFFCSLSGGWFRGLWPLGWQFWALGATYVLAVLAVSTITGFLKRKLNGNQ